MLDLYSQKLTAKVPANGPSQKGIVHLPTIRIQVLLGYVLVLGSVRDLLIYRDEH